jgi:hypothetical protein
MLSRVGRRTASLALLAAISPATGQANGPAIPAGGWEGNAGMHGGETDRENDEGLGDLRRYRGLLACLYTAGMIGGNAGYTAFRRDTSGRPCRGSGSRFRPTGRVTGCCK